MSPERWEHRAWFDGPSKPARRLSTLGEEIGAEYRTDTYLLTEDKNLLPKIRGGERFEIKKRLEVRGGLELWRMAVSEVFPLDGAVVAQVLPDAPRAALVDPGALEAYARTLARLTVSPVRKHRRRYKLGPAEAEVTAVMWGTVVTETVAVEAEELTDTQIAVAALGTGNLPNLHYGRRLSA